jgi:hypothetical protein
VRGTLLQVDGRPPTGVYYINIRATFNVAEIQPALASSEGLGGYTAVWMEEHDGAWHIYGRCIRHDGTLQPVEAISLGPNAENPGVDGGSRTAHQGTAAI